MGELFPEKKVFPHPRHVFFFFLFFFLIHCWLEPRNIYLKMNCAKRVIKIYLKQFCGS